eukprot:30664-Pelagococcus_subviridis.AAC.9
MSTSCRYRSCERTSSVYTPFFELDPEPPKSYQRKFAYCTASTHDLGASGLDFVTIDPSVTPLGNASGP